MKQTRPLLTLALILPLLGGGTLIAKAQPRGGGPDDGPLFDDGPGGHRPPGGPGGRDGRGAPGGRHGGAKGHLEGTWRGIKHLQSDEKSLSKAQAAKLVSLVKPWTSNAAMSDADAQQLAQSLEAVLTTAQKSKLGPPGRGRGGPGPDGGPPPGGGDFGPPPPRDGGDDRPPPPRDGDFGPPDGGGPPGEGGPEGGGPPPDGSGGRGRRPPMPQSFNPFYAPTGRSDWKKLPASTQKFLARHYNENRAVLESLSRFAKS